MNRLLAFSSFASAAAIAVAAPAYAGTCPNLGADTDCGFLITVNANGTITAASTAQGPYDRSEDTLVGVINNSTSPLTSLTLSGSNIFGFDGDGEAHYTGISYGPTGYEGPNTSFAVTNSNSGAVNFLKGGVAPNGGTSWFTLEENLADVTGGVTVVRGAVPEPATWAMMLVGFAGIGFTMRRRKVAIPDPA